MITIKQHLIDPIQKRQIQLVKVFTVIANLLTNPKFSTKWKLGRTNLPAESLKPKLIYLL